MAISLDKLHYHQYIKYSIRIHENRWIKYYCENKMYLPLLKTAGQLGYEDNKRGKRKPLFYTSLFR